MHAPKKYTQDIKSVVKYVIRYSGKPAIAQSRITDYDGEYVTFWYDRHEDNEHVTERVHVYEFFKRLIIHSPEKYFNLVRYYGLYTKHHKHETKIIHMVKSHIAKFRKTLKNWECRLGIYFNEHPLICSCCDHKLHFDYCLYKEYNTS